MLVTIIGPDGCGKSTVAEAIVDEAVELGYREGVHYATNFGILPTYPSQSDANSAICPAPTR